MKKNLLYLWALICSVSLLTACSSDDDNTVNDETTPPEEEAVVTAPDVGGTELGKSRYFNAARWLRPGSCDCRRTSEVYYFLSGQ